ncbi:hypothetical protein WJX72_011567 [[Myrmecia] bisecta]|uniref:Uncharacterized protein n=1 Tax=[Myrmecia] bisecta TaxID=41462 RepID=A0AAW1PTD1_9CHLO
MDLDKARREVRAASLAAAVMLKPLLPYTLHAACSATAYSACLGLTQVAGLATRVSSATPVFGPLMGVVGVGLASAMAGQASLACGRKLYNSSRPPRQHLPHVMRRNDLLLDAVLGIALFKVMGGRFRSLLPSDLFKAGAMARESIPAKGAGYANDVSRVELLRMMKRDGCHHCGRKRRTVDRELGTMQGFWFWRRRDCPPS